MVVLLCFVAVVVRLVQVQVVDEGQYVAFGAVAALQGHRAPRRPWAIFDRNGVDLAISIPQRTVWADTRLIEDPAGTAGALARLLSLDGDATTKLTAKLASGKAFTYVQRRVSRRRRRRGGGGPPSRHRSCSRSPSGSRRPVTWPGPCSARSAWTTRASPGLEKQYDDLLEGIPGELKVEQAPDGRTIPAGERQVQPAERGDDLVLTIDRSLQYETERALAAQILAKHAKGGTAIVTRPGHRRDPRHGQPGPRPGDRPSRRSATTRR